MTDLVPQPPTRVSSPVDDWVGVLEAVGDLAVRIADTDVVPKVYRGKPEQVAALILRGRELGLRPMAALSAFYVVGGVIALKSETMRALILAAGHEVWFTEASGLKVTIAGRRKHSKHVSELTWTLDMAQQAGYAQRNPNYVTVPRNMLKARCTADLARDLFPDCTGGILTVEELQDMASEDDGHQHTIRVRPVIPAAQPPALDMTPPPADAQPEPEPAPQAPPGPSQLASEPQRRLLFALARDLGLDERADRLNVASGVLGRDVDSFTSLTAREATQLIDHWQAVLSAPFGQEGPADGTDS